MPGGGQSGGSADIKWTEKKEGWKILESARAARQKPLRIDICSSGEVPRMVSDFTAEARALDSRASKENPGAAVL